MKLIYILSERLETWSGCVVALENAGWRTGRLRPEETDEIDMTEAGVIALDARGDGVRRLNALRERYPRKPIIYCLAEESFSELRAAVAAHAGAFALIPTEIDKIPEIAHELHTDELLREYKTNLAETKAQEMRQQIESQYQWEYLKGSSNIAHITRLIRKLYNTLTQADGFGAMISLIDYIKDNAPAKDGNYLVEKEILEQLFQSTRIGARIFKSMVDFVNHSSKPLDIKRQPLSEFFKLLATRVSAMDELLPIRNQKIVLAQPHLDYQNKEILIDNEKIDLVTHELLVNALKFSKKGDSIFVIPFANSFHYGYWVINPAYAFSKDATGVPKEYQTMVFNPFYRIDESANYDFFYAELTAGLGLGLTLVKEIIELHMGSVTIGNVQDHSGVWEKNPVLSVMAQISLKYA